MLNDWITKQEAALALKVSTDTIERRSIEWQEAPEPYRVRFKYLVLAPNVKPVPRYFRADVERFLVHPKKISKVSAQKIADLSQRFGKS